MIAVTREDFTASNEEAIKRRRVVQICVLHILLMGIISSCRGLGLDVLLPLAPLVTTY